MVNTGRSEIRFFARNFLQICLKYLQPVNAECGVVFCLASPLGKSLKVGEEHEGLSLVNAIFAPADNPRTLQKKLAV